MMTQESRTSQQIAPIEVLPPAAASTGFDGPPPLNMRDVWQILRRRRWQIGGMCLLLTIVASALILNLTKQYTAETSLLIEARQQQVVKIDDVVPNEPIDLEAVQSEVQVLRSRGLIGRVVDKLALDANPIFNLELKPKSDFALAREWVRERLQYAAGAIGLGDVFEPAPPLTAEQTRAEVLDAVLLHFTVDQEGKSRAIKLSFTSPDPVISASVVNTIADFYITSQLEAKFEARQRAAKWLNERLGDLKEQVKSADTAVDEFRRTAQLTGGGGGTPAAQQITQLNAQLITARASRAQAEANLHQAQKLVASGADNNSIIQVLQSPTIQALVTQESEIGRRVADLSQTYGDRHPLLAAAKAQLADVQKKIRREEDKVLSAMTGEFAAAQANETTLSQGVASLQAILAKQNSSEVKLHALEEEASADHALLDTFLARSKEISPDRSFETTDAEVISTAEVPRLPSFPKTVLMLATAFVLAAGASVLTGIGLERLDDRLRSADQVRTLLGATPLGLVPKVGGGVGSSRKDPFKAVNKRRSAFSESLLHLHTALMLSNVDTPARVVLMTSSFPGEGKTTVSTTLARTLARNGYKILLIDCDLRRPKAHTHFGVDQNPGLTDLLLSRENPKSAFKQDTESTAVLLPAGREAPNPQTILASAQMRSLIGEMRKHYDLIIINSPPIFAVSDAKILSTIADKTVYVARWGETRRKDVLSGLRQLHEVGADVAGVLLNVVDVSKHAHYGFTNSGLYHGRLSEYYAQ